MAAEEIETRQSHSITKARLFREPLSFREQALQVDVRRADWVGDLMDIAILSELIDVVIAPRPEHEPPVLIEPFFEPA